MIGIKKAIRYALTFLGSLLALMAMYFIIAIATSLVTVKESESIEKDKVIYLSTNGVHLDIVFPVTLLDSNVLTDLKYNSNDQFIAFGWGDENFYLNTPTWNDLKFSTAFSALFLNSQTLIHTTTYSQQNANWVPVQVNTLQLQKLQKQIHQSFDLNGGRKTIIPNAGYGYNDEFYKARGSYSCIHTCNTWVNDVFKNSGLKACLWTPFDTFLIDKYQEKQEGSSH